MGQRVVAAVEAAPDLELAWACGSAGPPSWAADVVVDFSRPDGLRRLLQHATCPVVSGTTGLTAPADPPVALLHAPNFSLGVAVLARLVREAREALPGWDVEVVELHHHGKVDAPSGTALRLVGGPAGTTNGRNGPRSPGEIGMHAVRGGDIVGEHHVYLCGPGERLQLAHVAHTRELFVEGALRAARWIVGRPPGNYTLESVLAP
jgi:4-hydroxy-tetrahydrodipicolinate reductase